MTICQLLGEIQRSLEISNFWTYLPGEAAIVSFAKKSSIAKANKNPMKKRFKQILVDTFALLVGFIASPPLSTQFHEPI
jgi:hypothetical protein